jgi:hypothetical protein
MHTEDTHYYNGHRIYPVQCSTSVKTEWRTFCGDLYTGRFLAEADTREEAIRLAELKLEAELKLDQIQDPG